MKNQIKNYVKYIRGHFFKYKIHVLDNVDTVKYIQKHPDTSVVRFGDGELDIINGMGIYYQSYNATLAKKLRCILLNGSKSNLLVCMPDVFKDLNRYNCDCRKFYYEDFFYQNKKILKEIQQRNNIYGSTFISRPYIDLKDKSKADIYFRQLRELWNNKDILIVEGKYSRSGEGNDLFSNANSIKRIICPSRNAFSYIENIEDAIKKYCSNKLILLMLGPTAKVIINDLKSQLDSQMIDLGHIDSEYEWFLMGVDSRVKIPNKHNAEIDRNDTRIDLKNDRSFQSQIIDEINGK